MRRNKNGTTASSKGAAKRKTRTELIAASEKFCEACIGTATVATVTQLTEYFSACNRYYCRSGNGIRAAQSCLQTIHGDTSNTKKTCTREQLTAYFLNTVSKDHKRIDRMQPLIVCLLKDAKNKSRMSDGGDSGYSDGATATATASASASASSTASISASTFNNTNASAADSDHSSESKSASKEEDRSQRIANVTSAAEKERARRAAEDLQHATTANQERKINQALAGKMMEDERARRMSMDQRAAMGEQLLKERHVKLVTNQAEAERSRRLSIHGTRMIPKVDVELKKQILWHKQQIELATEMSNALQQQETKTQATENPAAVLLEFEEADTNGDGVIDAAEFAAMKKNKLQKSTSQESRMTRVKRLTAKGVKKADSNLPKPTGEKKKSTKKNKKKKKKK